MQRGSEDEIAAGKDEWIGGQMEEWLEKRERESGEPQMEKKVKGGGDVKRGRKHRGAG